MTNNKLKKNLSNILENKKKNQEDIHHLMKNIIENMKENKENLTWIHQWIN